jgi:TPR repeat protein
MYEHGRGVAEYHAEADKWYRMAATSDDGDEDYRFVIGSMYDNGRVRSGSRKETALEAIRWYRLAAEQGYAEAQASLALMYFSGSGVEEDHAEAVKWYRLAAEQGHTEAQRFLGTMYRIGSGVEEDHAEAIKWYRLAADQGDIHAQGDLGDMYMHGQDHAEAAKWYRLAAVQGDGHASRELGRMYEGGEGVQRDLVEAFKWYTLAAEQGREDAKYKRLGDTVHIENDSEWVILTATYEGSRLPTVNPRREDAITNGRFVMISYKVTNQMKEEGKIQSPVLADKDGRVFSELSEQGKYRTKDYISEEKMVHISEQKLSPGVPYEFWALYELPVDAKGVHVQIRPISSSQGDQIGAFVILNLGE